MSDLPDSLSPPVSIVHRSLEVFQTTSCIGTELLYIGSSRSSSLWLSMGRGPLEFIAYEFVLTSPVVSHVPGSSNLDSFHDGWSVAVPLLFWGVLPPGIVQYSWQHSCVFAVNFFPIRFVSVHVVHPYSSIDTTAAWKKLRFILSVRSDFHTTESQSIAFHAFASRVLMPFLVNETLLPK